MAKKKVIKTRNAGTMTEAAFWSFIRSGLRQKSRWWKPITQCKLVSRRDYKGPLKRQKYEYQCNKCKGWFPEKKINVDHIVPAGSLNCAQDLPLFVETLFCVTVFGVDTKVVLASYICGKARVSDNFISLITVN